MGFKLTTLVIGIDCTGSCKSNYHTIATTMAFHEDSMLLDNTEVISFMPFNDLYFLCVSHYFFFFFFIDYSVGLPGILYEIKSIKNIWL